MYNYLYPNFISKDKYNIQWGAKGFLLNDNNMDIDNDMLIIILMQILNVINVL